MKFIILFLVTFSIRLIFSQDVISDPLKLNIGEIHTIFSKSLNEERKLNIYLPQNYSADSTYPVVYVLDGSLHEDFLHIVGLTQFFNLQFTMQPHIVVGIENVDRKRDFTHATELQDLKTSYPTAGNSDRFIQALELEIKPYIESVFSTNETDFLIGQSLGGLVATEILFQKPQLFSHYFIISPSLWWDNESMLKARKKQVDFTDFSGRTIYVSVGKHEHKIMKREARSLKRLLSRSKTNNLKTHFKLMRNEDHATILHRSVYEGFLWLFPVKK